MALQVGNTDGFLEKENDYILQNITTQLTEDIYKQLIVYFEIKKLPLRNGKNRIAMYAENLGDIPSNTATLSIHVDGEQLYTFFIESDILVSKAIELVEE
jgi:hypothetical protein